MNVSLIHTTAEGIQDKEIVQNSPDFIAFYGIAIIIK